MKKSFLVVLVAVLVATLSAPAWAVDINGWFAIRGTMSNGRDNGGSFVTSKDSSLDKTNSFVEQRARMKFTFGDENVKFVYQNELDQQWGDGTGPVKGAVGAGSGSGGGLGTDGVNLETKNAYLWFKAPGNFQVLAGLVNLSDSYGGLIYGGSDFAAFAGITDFGPVNVTMAAAKWTEGNTDKADDQDVYFIMTKTAPAKDMSLGVNLHYIKSRAGLYASGNKLDLFVPGVDFTGAFGPAKINAFAFYQTGKWVNAAGQTATVGGKVGGFAADVRADVTAGPGAGYFEALYVSGDKKSTDDKYQSIYTADTFKSGQAFYGRSGLNILFRNPADLNSGSVLFGNANGDDGLMLLAAGYGMKVAEPLKLDLVAGYATVAVKDEALAAQKNKTLGTELGAKLTYAVQKGLDASFAVNYLMTGDYFKASTTADVADIYMASGMLKYAF